MLEVEEQEVLGITKAQEKKATYPDPCTKKERMKEEKNEVELAMEKENKIPLEKPGTSPRSEAETNIVRKVLQTIIPIKVMTFSRLCRSWDWRSQTSLGMARNHNQGTEGKNWY